MFASGLKRDAEGEYRGKGVGSCETQDVELSLNFCVSVLFYAKPCNFFRYLISIHCSHIPKQRVRANLRITLIFNCSLWTKFGLQKWFSQDWVRWDFPEQVSVLKLPPYICSSGVLSLSISQSYFPYSLLLNKGSELCSNLLMAEKCFETTRECCTRCCVLFLNVFEGKNQFMKSTV